MSGTPHRVGGFMRKVLTAAVAAGALFGSAGVALAASGGGLPRS